MLPLGSSKVIEKSTPREGKKALEFEKPIVIAHRGGLAEAPENTMAAFSKSAALGVHGFAIDVRLTKDEEIIVFHDEFVDRTTDFKGKVSDFTFSELKEADVATISKMKTGIILSEERVKKYLSLRELLESFPHLFVSINLRILPIRTKVV